jgi:hypothetical protein
MENLNGEGSVVGVMGRFFAGCRPGGEDAMPAGGTVRKPLPRTNNRERPAVVPAGLQGAVL